MMASQSEKNVLRTAVMRIMSEMLDDPDEHGIYPTGRFMDRIESLLQSMMAAPEVLHLSGSEALFGFAAWISAKDAMMDGTSLDNCGLWADWVKEFCETNHLHEPREQWHTLLIHPKGDDNVSSQQTEADQAGAADEKEEAQSQGWNEEEEKIEMPDSPPLV